jgi:hypothetical protein
MGTIIIDKEVNWRWIADSVADYVIGSIKQQTKWLINQLPTK